MENIRHGCVYNRDLCNISYVLAQAEADGSSFQWKPSILIYKREKTKHFHSQLKFTIGYFWKFRHMPVNKLDFTF